MLFLIGLATLFAVIATRYSLRDAALLALLVPVWWGLRQLSARDFQRALFLLCLSFAVYQIYILDINRGTPNVGVVWFILLITTASLTGRVAPILFWGAVAIGAILFTAWRAPADDPLWAHPMSLPNLLGTYFVMTATCALLQWLRQKHESQLTAQIAHSEKLSEQLSAANADLALSKEAKSRLLAMIGHELRTPMMTIVAAAEQLETSNGDASPHTAEGLTSVAIIRKSAENIADLMTDVLTLETLGAGVAKTEPKPFDLFDLAQNACELTCMEAPDALIVLDPDPDLPQMVCGDATRLRQILTNLLRNAINHSGTLEACLRITAPKAGHLCFSVIDRGIGLDPDAITRIFDPYVQIGANPHGSGLGLAITKEFVNLLSGQVEVRSESGAGTRFNVNLPLRSDGTKTLADRFSTPQPATLAYTEATPAPVVQAAKRWELRGNRQPIVETRMDLDELLQRQQHRVFSIQTLQRGASEQRHSSVELPSGKRHSYSCLIGEDDPLLSQLLSQYFSAAGFEVALAHDGPAANDLIGHNHFDLLVLDMTMPGPQTGLDLVRRARSSAIPPVICALSGFPEYQSLAEAAGVDRFMVKPVRMQVLRDTALELLNARAAQDVPPTGLLRRAPQHARQDPG
ncbi:hybrid sensor histidine kinase/response regulator [Palleronia caenipelagi]|nr:hybrid sensor histidine kinase/response regulator [Palleronia caenipelagi]